MVFQSFFSRLHIVELLLVLVLALASYSPPQVFKASGLDNLFSQLLVLVLASEASTRVSPCNIHLGLGPSLDSSRTSKFYSNKMTIR